MKADPRRLSPHYARFTMKPLLVPLILVLTATTLLHAQSEKTMRMHIIAVRTDAAKSEGSVETTYIHVKARGNGVVYETHCPEMINTETNKYITICGRVSAGEDRTVKKFATAIDFNPDAEAPDPSSGAKRAIYDIDSEVEEQNKKSLPTQRPAGAAVAANICMPGLRNERPWPHPSRSDLRREPQADLTGSCHPFSATYELPQI